MPPTTNKSKVPIGTVLEGKYRISREIGRGGMAAVYEAENVQIGKRVAVKVLAAELITSRVVRERFLREARAAAAIRSPYICDVYDSGTFEERPFLVMELLEGESLYDHLSRVRRLTPARAVELTRMVARGLEKAHAAGVVHRDLKPENIFLCRGEEGATVAKVLDFGLAKFYEPTGGTAAQARLTREGALFGTPAYMSPEQAKGKGEVDLRADLWALGCIVYECLTGKTVWNVDQGVAMILAQIAGAPIPLPRRLRPDLPEALDVWFLKAVERDPALRYQTARELADALEVALADAGTGRPPPPSATPKESEPVLDPSLLAAPPDATGQLPAIAPGPAGPAPAPAPPAEGDEEEEEAGPKRGAGRAIAVLTVAALVAAGGGALALYATPPSPSAGRAPLPSVVRSTSPAASTSATAAAVAPLAAPSTDPVGTIVGAAQRELDGANLGKALEHLREAYRISGSGVAMTLRDHVATAQQAGTTGPCKLVGVGRPRPYERIDHASAPTLARTTAGLLVGWVDGHPNPRTRQAHVALLGATLGPLRDSVGLTPEALLADNAELAVSDHGLALLWTDAALAEPGIYVRRLDKDGSIASSPRRVSGPLRERTSPDLALQADGSGWVVWPQELDLGVQDLVARRLDASLAPQGEPIRLTAFAPTRGLKTAAEEPRVAIAGKELLVLFTLERLQHPRTYLLRVPLDSPELLHGLAAGSKKSGANLRKQDASVGKLAALGAAGRAELGPQLSCGPNDCFFSWDDARSGVFAARFDLHTHEVVWQREFATTGSRPTPLVHGDRALMTWFDASKVRVAPLTRDGVGPSSVLARVSTAQSSPVLAAGTVPGEWIVGWREYEAGHLESFVARARCQ